MFLELLICYEKRENEFLKVAQNPVIYCFLEPQKKRKLTHAGIVVGTKRGEPLFIHASSSRGVIVSSLREGYWNKAYAQTRRMIK